MEFVSVDGTYRGILQTLDASDEATWPDIDIASSHLAATKEGAAFGGAITVTENTTVGEHTITLDATGAVAGEYLQLTGEYYVDGIRYYFSEEIYVDAGPTIQKIAEADQRFLLDGGVYKLVVYEKGTATEILTRKNIKQLDGTDMTSPSTQVLGGFQEP